MSHAQLVKAAEQWLRSQRCRIVLSEQTADSGEVPDVIGWKAGCRSVVIECKVSRADFWADQQKLVRRKPHLGMGCERYYLVPKGLLNAAEVPNGWGLLEYAQRAVALGIRAQRETCRTESGLLAEMELLLASLRRVEVRIEPQTITEFLKWKNRLAEYNGGQVPQGLIPPEQESIS